MTPAPPSAPGELTWLLESGATYAFDGEPIKISGAGITVRISTTGAAPAILDAQHLSRHFIVVGATLELEHLLLVNGCRRARMREPRVARRTTRAVHAPRCVRVRHERVPTGQHELRARAGFAVAHGDEHRTELLRALHAARVGAHDDRVREALVLEVAQRDRLTLFMLPHLLHKPVARKFIDDIKTLALVSCLSHLICFFRFFQLNVVSFG